MKYSQAVTGRFKKDVKKVKAQGKDTKKIKKVMLKILKGEALPVSMKDHVLVGNIQGSRECHLEPDWLLIYKVDAKQVTFERTESHSDLFK